MKNVLITGVAGFIGFHLAKKLLLDGYTILGIDLINFDENSISSTRLKILVEYKNFKYFKTDLSEFNNLTPIFNDNNIDSIIHLAAKSGVRDSHKNTQEYFRNNVLAFYNVLEHAKTNNIKKIIYASSSSVYGKQNIYPLKEEFQCNPISFYGTTKQMNELMASSYAQINDLNIIGLRFTTVYGSYGREDMAISKFIKAIKNGEKIELYNEGKNLRCYTYIDDIVTGIAKVLTTADTNLKSHEIYNLGSSELISTLDLVYNLEKLLNKKAKIHFQNVNIYEMESNLCDNSKFYLHFNYECKMPLKEKLTKVIIQN